MCNFGIPTAYASNMPPLFLLFFFLTVVVAAARVTLIIMLAGQSFKRLGIVSGPREGDHPFRRMLGTIARFALGFHGIGSNKRGV